MLTDQQIDEFLEMVAKSPTSARDMVRGLFAAHEAKAAPAVPQGYEIHEIPADYSGLVWLEGQVRAVARRDQAATGPQGWTDADSDAARLALELECLLMDTKDLSVVSKWWGSANDALELHRQRLAATPAPAPAQEVGLTDGERQQVFRAAENRMVHEINLSWRNAVVDEVIAALRAKGQS